MVEEAAELTLRDLGDERAARAAQQAATGRIVEIARLPGLADIHLLGYPKDRIRGGVGAAEVQPRRHGRRPVRPAVNSFILISGDKPTLLRPRPGRAAYAHETVEESRTVECSVDESRELLLAW